MLGCPRAGMFCFKKKRYHGGISSVEEESAGAQSEAADASPKAARHPITPPRLVVEPSSDAESLEGRSRSASGTVPIDVAVTASANAAAAASAANASDAAPGGPDSPSDGHHSSAGTAQSLPGSYVDSGPPSPVSAGVVSPVHSKSGKQRGRSLELPGICVHCLHYETWLHQNPDSSRRGKPSLSRSDSSSSDDEEEDSHSSRCSSIPSSRSPSEDSRASSDVDGRSEAFEGQDEEEDDLEVPGMGPEDEEEDESSAGHRERQEDAVTDDSGRSTPNPATSSVGSSCGGGTASGAFLQVR